MPFQTETGSRPGHPGQSAGPCRDRRFPGRRLRSASERTRVSTNVTRPVSTRPDLQAPATVDDVHTHVHDMRRGDTEWTVPSPEKSLAMRGVRKIGTAPEMELRRRLHRGGLRFRIGLPVPGRPRRTIDIAFTRARLAVFVDGCFWHGCPDHGGKPRTNAAFWEAKIAGNRTRDRETDAHLEGAGWVVLRLWEHVLPAEAVYAVRAALAARGPSGIDREARSARRIPEPE